MLISVPIIVLGSHLAITVADNVPKFDIARGCRLDNTASSGLTEEQPMRKCLSDEQQSVSAASKLNGLNSPSPTRQPAPPRPVVTARQAMSNC